MERETTAQTFKTAILLALVCSIAVSSLAVGLRSTQQMKKEEFRQQNILRAAGLLAVDDVVTGAEVAEIFRERITPVVLDFDIGKLTTRYKPGDVSIEVAAALRDSQMSDPIDGSSKTGKDIAGIRRRETYATIYEVRTNGQLETLVLPIRGYGLWSTLWGFIAIDISAGTADPADLTVKGLTYYAHKETAGLGGEVDNPLWKEKWPGKRVYDEDWNVNLEVTKSAAGDYQVDALSGATLTSNGVSNMLAYWMGDYGFGPYIKSLLESRAQGDSDSEEAAADTNAAE